MPLIQTSTIPAPFFHSRRFSPPPSRSFLLFSSLPQQPSFSIPFSTPSFNPSFPQPHQLQPQPQPYSESDSDDDDDDAIIGDCVVFEEGAFDQPINSFNSTKLVSSKISMTQRKKRPEPQGLVPDKWKEVVDEINLTKKERRKIAYELKFGNKLERKKPRAVPSTEEYRIYREMKRAELNPVVREDETDESEPDLDEEMVRPEPQSRAVPRNPRWEVYRGKLGDIDDFFRSSKYLDEKDSDSKQARTKLFTKEEKMLLNRRVPDLSIATNSKWMMLHFLAATGELYLFEKLLQYNIDINSADKDGMTALHRAILCKKQAIVIYLLKNSANPFVRDNNGATLMHYAVQTASSQAIKTLLLYNLDINLSDNDGWTPLHLAVQTQRADMAKLLLIKGADRSIKNNEGLTPLELCLYSGRNVKTYELIKLLKEFNVSKPRT